MLPVGLARNRISLEHVANLETIANIIAKQRVVACVASGKHALPLIVVAAVHSLLDETHIKSLLPIDLIASA